MGIHHTPHHHHGMVQTSHVSGVSAAWKKPSLYVVAAAVAGLESRAVAEPMTGGQVEVGEAVADYGSVVGLAVGPGT